MSGLAVIAEFVAAMLLIGISGSVLSRCADAVAERTGISGTWIGLVVLATITSLPELITGVSAVGLVHTPDIAVGAILGSCVFNLAILVVLDVASGHESVYSSVKRDHLLSGGFGVILIGLVGFDLMLQHSGQGIALGPVSLSTPLIVLVYWTAVRSVYRRELDTDGARDAEAAPDRPGALSRSVYAELAVGAAVVVAAGLWLPFVGERMATVLHIHETFVGTLFIAFATSLPELAVSVAAVRIGKPDMAVSNLLGSNLFNILVLVPEDLILSDAPLLSAASAGNALSALSAVMMTGIAMVALLVKPRGSRLGGVSLLLLSIYLVNTYLIFLYRA